MTRIASVGVIVAAAALFIVLSVFAGLKNYSLQFSSFVDPDLTLLPMKGKSMLFTDDEKLKLNKIKGIAFFSEVIEERVIIKSENKNLLATLKGVDSSFLDVTNVDLMVTSGSWISPESNDVVSGWGISNNLSFGILDYRKALALYVPKPGVGQASAIKSLYNSTFVNNVGLFDINEELNSEFVFSDIGLARRLLNYNENQISAIELKLNPSANEDDIREEINSVFNNKVSVKK